jgi:putative FmdB family regulatory protein
MEPAELCYSLALVRGQKELIAMPIYEYVCEKCGSHIEVMQKMSDEPLKRCRECRGKLEKIISRTAFQLKGSGWYKTDYSSSSSKAESKGSAKSGDAKAESAKSDKKGEGSTPSTSSGGSGGSSSTE